MERYPMLQIINDLREKMVFVVGPRPVGKTALAFFILHGYETHPAYLNWDLPVPPANPDPVITVQNEKEPAAADPETGAACFLCCAQPL